MPDPASFPTDTHPADDLDLDEVGSDFAFGRPCDIPPGIVGDATRVVFDTHWPALLRAVQAYRKRVDALEAALVGERTRYDACAMALGDCGSRLMAARRDVEQAHSERNYWRTRALDGASVQRFAVGGGEPTADIAPEGPRDAPVHPDTRETALPPA